MRPFEKFVDWYREAQNSESSFPEAMILATASKSGRPSSRTVLMKGYEDFKITFFTNYGSQKAQDIAENPQAEVLFYWKTLEKQVRLYGSIEKCSREKSEEYFKSRPRQSQIAAYLSKQGQVLDDYQGLLNTYLKMVESGEEVDCPENWGGYTLTVNEAEFWKSHPYRLHERSHYYLRNGTWESNLVYP